MSQSDYMPTDDQGKALLFLQFAANIGASCDPVATLAVEAV